MKVGNAKDANRVEIRIDSDAFHDGVIRQAHKICYIAIFADFHLYSSCTQFSAFAFSLFVMGVETFDGCHATLALAG